MEDDDFSFDFESKLEEQQKVAAAAPGPVRVPGNSTVPVNQSAGSFKRNYRQVGNPPDLSPQRLANFFDPPAERLTVPVFLLADRVHLLAEGGVCPG